MEGQVQMLLNLIYSLLIEYKTVFLDNSEQAGKNFLSDLDDCIFDKILFSCS